jgi:hypothetical protein
MSTEAQQETPRLPAKTGSIPSGGRVAAIVPQTADDVYRLANAIARSSTAPRGYMKGKGDNKEPDVDAIFVGIMHGLEVGLTPLAALQSIAVINGQPTIWGDGAIALVYASGEIEDIEEVFDGKPYDADFTAICRIWRKGRKRPTEIRFSVDDAMRAGLWQASATKRAKVWKDGALVWSNDAPNDSPWYRYPKRMLQMRARSWALRDSCADILRGLSIREEVEDMAAAAGHVEPAGIVVQQPLPPEEAPAQIAAPAAPSKPPDPIGSAAVAAEVEAVMDAVLAEEDAPEPPEDEPAPPEDEPESPRSVPRMPKVEIDDVTFIRNIETELKKLAIGDPDLLAKFEAINTACESRYEGGTMFPPDIGALSDLVEKYRKELDL